MGICQMNRELLPARPNLRRQLTHSNDYTGDVAVALSQLRAPLTLKRLAGGEGLRTQDAPRALYGD